MCVTAQVGRGCKRQPCGLHRTEIGILEGNDIGICRPSRVRLNPDIGRPYLLSRDKRCALCDFELTGVRIPPPRPSGTELGPRVQNALAGPKCRAGTQSPPYRALDPGSACHSPAEVPVSAEGSARASANSAPRRPRPRPPQLRPDLRVRSAQPQAPPHTITGPALRRELAPPRPLRVPPRLSSQPRPRPQRKFLSRGYRLRPSELRICPSPLESTTLQAPP